MTIEDVDIRDDRYDWGDKSGNSTVRCIDITVIARITPKDNDRELEAVCGDVLGEFNHSLRLFGFEVISPPTIILSDGLQI